MTLPLFLFLAVGYILSMIALYFLNRSIQSNQNKVDLLSGMVLALGSWFTLFCIFIAAFVLFLIKYKIGDKIEQLNKRFEGRK